MSSPESRLSIRAAVPAHAAALAVLGERVGYLRTHVGPALMRACLDEATRAGYDAAWLAVWQQGSQALAFYRKWGFAGIGPTIFRLGSDLQSDFLLCRTLARPAGT